MGRKQLSDFPRPPDDNGRGVHWSASVYHPSGAALQQWIKELQALQIKWVKLLDDGGTSSLEICRALLDNGIMPIVRIYRDRPNPGHLDGRGVDAVHKLVAAGVRYIEANNEPDLPAEWKNNHRPANWLDVVVENFIWDADTILKEGGLPAYPAMGPGNQSNGIAKVVDRGRKDIFERGAWVAIHNYTLNHPLDYPGDAVNQTGQPLTAEEYAYFQRWQFSHLTLEEAQRHGVSSSNYHKYQNWAWDGRSMAQVNALRATAKNPGKTIFDDAYCFRAFEWWGATIEQTLGFHVPIMSTEGGPVVGWGDDKRYAKISTTTQAEWQMAINRFLQDEAPVWYFTCCTWLLASKPLGDFNPTWDQMSWYTHSWDQQFGLTGELPLVRLLKETPSKVRHELRQPASKPGTLEGAVISREGTPVVGLTLMLRLGEDTVATGQTGVDGRYRLTAPPGQYDLVADWVGVMARSITLTEGDVDAIDLKDVDAIGDFRIGGTVADGAGHAQAGVQVKLHRSGLVQRTTTSDNTGAYEFKPGVEGAYIVAVGTATANVSVSRSLATVTANITVQGHSSARYALTAKRLLSKAETENNRLFFGRVVDKDGKGIKNVELEMRWTGAASGTTFPRTRTGQNPYKPEPDGYYEFANSSGTFSVRVVQGDFPSDTADDLVTAGVPGRVGDPISYEVNFQLQPASTSGEAKSMVSGKVLGGRVGQVVTLWAGQQSRKYVLDANRTFRFEALPAGLYELALAGVGIVQSDLALDGENKVTIDFPVLGAIVGAVANVPRQSRTVSLISETYGFTRHAELTSDYQYRFTNLPAGLYRVELGDDMVTGLVGDGTSVLRAPVLRVGAGVVIPAAESRLSGTLRDGAGHVLAATEVVLQREGRSIATTRTNDEGAFAFEALEMGFYQVAIGDAVLASDLFLDGESILTVDIVYAPQAPAKPLGRYYLLGAADAALQPALLHLMGPWLASQPAGAVGFSATEAQQAATVILLGDGISDEAVAGLQAAGSQLIDLRKDLLALAPVLVSRGAATPAAMPFQEVPHA